MKRPMMAALAVALTLSVSACGGGSDNANEPKVDEETKFQQAALEHAECMRENGIDMPDPQFTEGGGARVALGDGDNEIDPGSESFQKAEKACESIMEGLPGLGDDRTPAEKQEMQDKMVEFAQCMRDNGVPMDDPTFDEKGRVTMRMGGSKDDPKVPEETMQAAQKACRDKDVMGGGPVIGGGPKNTKTGEVDGGPSFSNGGSK